MKEIHQFLGRLPEQSCPHCGSVGYLKLHDTVYRFQDDCMDTVGKRVYCSNRYQQSGCGRTWRFRLASRIPALHYSACTVMVFLILLIRGKSITLAYQQATGQHNARHAYRWLNQLFAQLCTFRGLLPKAFNLPSCIIYRSHRLQCLLPTMLTLICYLGLRCAARFQTVTQRRWM